MGSEEFMKLVKHLIQEFYIKQARTFVHEDDIYIVWLSKTLQNTKAMASTSIKDQRYFEITFNGDKSEAYLDVYKKELNQAHPITDAEVILDGAG